MIYTIVNALQKLVSNKAAPQKTGKATSPVDSDIDWGVPTEIVGQLPSAPELEHSMLPKLIADYAFEQARLLDNAPPVFCATSIIATAAALIGGSVTISPKRFDKEWKLKPIIWQINVGEPSTKKTPCQKVGLDLFTHAINTVIEPANEE
ncbi:MAG: DUF3987 domain-containing protein, partial [Shewanella xiamenensis]|nr:DUF3987 domain-containing protein [Shewanella xiamenensis]